MRKKKVAPSRYGQSFNRSKQHTNPSSILSEEEAKELQYIKNMKAKMRAMKSPIIDTLDLIDNQEENERTEELAQFLKTTKENTAREMIEMNDIQGNIQEIGTRSEKIIIETHVSTDKSMDKLLNLKQDITAAREKTNESLEAGKKDNKNLEVVPENNEHVKEECETEQKSNSTSNLVEDENLLQKSSTLKKSKCEKNNELENTKAEIKEEKAINISKKSNISKSITNKNSTVSKKLDQKIKKYKELEKDKGIGPEVAKSHLKNNIKVPVNKNKIFKAKTNLQEKFDLNKNNEDIQSKKFYENLNDDVSSGENIESKKNGSNEQNSTEKDEIQNTGSIYDRKMPSIVQKIIFLQNNYILSNFSWIWFFILKCVIILLKHGLASKLQNEATYSGSIGKKRSFTKCFKISQTRV